MILEQAIYLLKLRLRIGVRLMRDLGWVRAFLLGVFAIFLVGQLAIIPGNSANWGIVFLGFVAIGTIHQRRSDLHFLRALTLNCKISIAVEYLAISLPFLIILLYRGAPGIAILMLMATVVMPFIPQSGKEITRDKHYRPSLFCNLQSYEWIAGFRRFKIILIAFIILGMMLSAINYIAVYVILYLMTALISGFYAECEPRRLLLISAAKPTWLLLNKIGKGAGLYIAYTLPVWGSLFIVYPDKVLYTILFVLVNLLLLSSVIIAKYMFYVEGRSLEFPLVTLFSVLTLFSFFPYLQIALIPLLIFFWIKAVSRLEQRVYA